MSRRFLAAALLLASLAPPAAAQDVSVPALLRSMGVPLDKRGAEGAFDDGLRPTVAVQPAMFNTLASVMAGAADARLRVDAAYAFGIFAGPGAPAVPAPDLAQAGGALMQMLVTPNQRMRVAAARVAGRLSTTPFSATAPTPRPAGLIEALFAMMNADAEIEQLAAMDAVGRLREPTAVNALIERFAYYRRRGTRAQAGGAVEALARIGHSAAVPLVTGLVNDPWSHRDDATGLAVLFARERLLQDGSLKGIRDAFDRGRLRVQARGYLEELRRQ